MSGSESARESCAFCGLPLAGSPLSVLVKNGVPPSAAVEDRAAAGDAPVEENRYCCFGCRIAAAATNDKGESGQSRWMFLRLGLAIFCAMNVMVFTMALWSQDVYQTSPVVDANAALFYTLFRYLALIFSLPVLFLLGGPLVESALAELLRGRPSTDLLLALGVGASFAYSLVAVWSASGAIYFEVGCMVLVAVTLGRWLEATGKLKTTLALRSLHRLLPERVRKVAGGNEARMPLAEVEVGHVLRILPGERLPVDGIIIAGRAAIDEQIITGESEPNIKETGSAARSGGLNLDGHLLLRATATPSAGTLQRLVETLTQAALCKGRYERLADRVSAVFLPAVAVISLAVFGVHFWLFDFPSAVLAGLAVVVIACPCALGLATPLALWAALGRASREGVLFQSGDALARLSGAKAICFDKTGTLTTGLADVHELITPLDVPRRQVLRVAAALAQATNHGLAAAIGRFANMESCALPSDVVSLAGRGISAKVQLDANQPALETVWLGSPRLLRENGQDLTGVLQEAVADAMAAARPIACVAWRGAARGVFTFTESLRPEAERAVAACRRLGLAPIVLTGDHAARAAALASLLGAPARGELLPEDKLAEIQEVRREHGPVVMVGDGVNDAPALAAADVGIALGSGADVSRQTADVCLVGNDLSRLPWAIDLARQTVRTIRWNLLWAFAYNTVGIGLAAAGWLSPILAALAMAASSLLVIGNSLRLSGSSETESGHLQPDAAAPTPGDALSAGLLPKGEAA